MVENHERVEAVKMELRDALRTTGNSYLRLSAADEVGAKDDGVGCRRAGRGDAGTHREQLSVAAGYQFGGCTTVVGADVVVARVVLQVV